MRITLRRLLLLAVSAAFTLAPVAAQVTQPAAGLSYFPSVAVDDADTVTVAGNLTTLTIVERLGQPESGVVVDAPEELLKRAARQAEEQAEQADSTDEATEGQDEERVTRTKSGKTVGYRVQVFADNNMRTAKAEARQRERAVGQAFPAYSTYVAYASPYWRLRVGDFRSQYEAEKAAAEIRKAFPRYAREVRVVRDHVNVR